MTTKTVAIAVGIALATGLAAAPPTSAAPAGSPNIEQLAGAKKSKRKCVKKVSYRIVRGKRIRIVKQRCFIIFFGSGE